ncbi:MAG: InlB B-repeat-containing protein [Thermomicrobiales bacterium]
MPRARLVAILACFLLLLPHVALAAPRASAAVPPNYAPGQIIVGFAPGSTEQARDAAIARHGGRTLQRLAGIHARVVAAPAGHAPATEVSAYASEGVVRYSEPNYLVHAAGLPNDPELAEQWALHNTGQTEGGLPGIAGADIGASAAWDTTQGDRNIVVGVVDSGIDYTHPDLAANIWSAPPGWNLSDCGAGTHGYQSLASVTGCEPFEDNTDSHGTHVAGIIGAAGDNGVGISGVNWRVSLMALQFLDARGTGTISDALAVIQYAISAKQAGINLRVLNTSWGSTTDSRALRDAIALAGANDILVVAAAGNESSDLATTPVYPASYGAAPYNLPNIIAVTATRNNDSRVVSSDFGLAVPLGAPGWYIRSTVQGGRYAEYTGTSQAAAYVSGGAALVLAAPGLGSLSATDLKTRLLACGDAVSVLTDFTATGRRLDVGNSVTNTNCAPVYSLNLSATTGGSIVPSLPGPYPAGSHIIVTATPAPGYTFVNWTIDGATGATANPYSFSPLAADHTVSAQFAPAPTYALALSASGPGRVSATPAGPSYAAGTQVCLTATPDTSAFFIGWTVDGQDASKEMSICLTMDRDHTAVANFAQTPPSAGHTLTLPAVPGGTAQASVPNPIKDGANVTITARPDAGYFFTGWLVDGVAAGDANPYTLTMTADHTVTPVFVPARILLLSSSGGGSAKADAPGWRGGSPYPDGVVVTLTATPNTGYVFTGWTIDGVFQGWANPLTMTMNDAHSVVANFARRHSYPDLPPGPAPYEAVSQLTARDIIRGYKNGDVGPSDLTLRAQMAALIARAMGWDTENWGTAFPDQGPIDDDLWRNVGTLAHYDVARGYPDGTYRPLDPVLQAQVISFITRGMVARHYWSPVTEDEPALYPNVPLASGHRFDLLTYYHNAGAIPGAAPEQPWLPWAEPATRGWFALALWQALDSYFGVDRVP